MSQETTNTQEQKKESGEFVVSTPADVLSQGPVYDSDKKVNSFLIELKSLLIKHNVSINTNANNDDVFFVVEKVMTDYPISTLLKSIGIKESSGHWSYILD